MKCYDLFCKEKKNSNITIILCYGDLKVILETTFRHFSSSSFILTSSNIYIQGLLSVKFYSFALEID